MQSKYATSTTNLSRSVKSFDTLAEMRVSAASVWDTKFFCIKSCVVMIAERWTQKQGIHAITNTKDSREASLRLYASKSSSRLSRRYLGDNENLPDTKKMPCYLSKTCCIRSADAKRPVRSAICTKQGETSAKEKQTAGLPNEIFSKIQGHSHSSFACIMLPQVRNALWSCQDPFALLLWHRDKRSSNLLSVLHHEIMKRKIVHASTILWHIALLLK